MKTDTNTQKKYINQTYQLDRARQELVKTVTSELTSQDEYTSAYNRLQEIYQAQASNAVILADMLAYHIGKGSG